jgi:hypothetical protein
VSTQANIRGTDTCPAVSELANKRRRTEPPQPLRPATALHRVVVTDVEGPTYDHKSWFTSEHQLAQYINKWFNDVRTWTEVLTGQDLDPNHRVYDAEAVGAGLTFIEPPHDGALALTLTTPRVRPLRAQEWAAILGLVRDGSEPPLEWVLSRDARAAHRRTAHRRAIIDAATASRSLSAGMSATTPTNCPQDSENASASEQRSATTSQSPSTPTFS